MSVNPIYQRMQLLTGTVALQRLNQTRVAIFGLGGVGSWAAEALVRSGVLDITLVDNDVICITNVNRQLQATTENVGEAKVTELARRLMTLNPRCRITSRQEAYDDNHPAAFDLGSYDYVLDCIDSISCKVALMTRSVTAGTRLYSALGAAGKLDPTKIRVGSIWETQGHCPLARLIRRKLRAVHFGGDFQAVFSTEPVTLVEQSSVACGTHKCHCPQYIPADGTEYKDWCAAKKVINGSAVHITATFGMFLSGLVIQDVVARAAESSELQPPLTSLSQPDAAER